MNNVEYKSNPGINAHKIGIWVNKGLIRVRACAVKRKVCSCDKSHGICVAVTIPCNMKSKWLRLLLACTVCIMLVWLAVQWFESH